MRLLKKSLSVFAIALATLNCHPIKQIIVPPIPSEHSTSPLGGIGNLGKEINSTTDDYAPKMIGNTLIFSSGITVQGKYPKLLKSELFKADHKENFSDKQPVEIGWPDAPELVGKPPMQGTTLNLNEGAIDILPDQGYAVFAAEKITGKSGQSSLMDLYEVKFDAKNFIAKSNPVPIDAVNDPDAWDSQPALSRDGKTLFFVSDRPISPSTVRGNQHIYRSDKIDGKWGSPKILGAPYTTNGNEVSPYIGPDGYFYFSSDGNPDSKETPPGLGKRDIYKVKFAGGNLAGVPERLPAPFNSPADDDFPSMTNDCRTMLLASDREGGAGQRDIYAFTIPVVIQLKGTVTRTTVKDGEKQIPVPYQTVVSVVDKNGNIILANLRTDKSGGYSTNLAEDHEYIVTVSKPSCIDSVAPAYVLASRNPNTTDMTTITRDFNVVDSSFKITLGKESSIPYFITGYWRPNTPENLAEFRNRAKDPKFMSIIQKPGEKMPRKYIDSSKQKDMQEYYDSYSTKIEETLRNKVYEPILNIVHTRLSDACQGEQKILRIHIDGFTDGRTVTEGDYLDENVPAANNEPEIHNGDQMSDRSISPDGRKMSRNEDGNMMLSHLRAYFTMKNVKEYLCKADRTFEQYCNSVPPRIIFSFEGKGIDRSINQDDQSKAFNRRIDITAKIE